MNNTAVSTIENNNHTNMQLSIIEQVVMQGDLSRLNPEQRVIYYRKVCESSGLNPYTNPFAYISLNGKLTLYAKKDCTEQLRKINGVSIEGLDDKVVDDLYIVKARARDKHGRTDESTGAVSFANLKGEAKANAIMKAETKAKRRVTLSICGMGWTDESEIDSIPHAAKVDVDLSTGEIKGQCEKIQPPEQIISQEQTHELEMILGDCDPRYKDWLMGTLKNQMNVLKICDLPLIHYEKLKDCALKQMNAYHAQQRASESKLELAGV